MDYATAIKWLYGTQLFGIKLGLENVRRLCGEFGVPGGEGHLIHVAGTNGKGSVCAFADSICRAGGHRTGLFTSPHLVSFRERISVDGEWISEAEAAAGLTELREAVSDWDPHPTFFELATVLALRHFSRRRVEVAILETGMGGRLDATTAAAEIHREAGGELVSVITPIGMDHQEWLGDSLAAVAGEKAGIMQAGAPVVSALQAEAVVEVLRDEARRLGSEIRFVDETWDKGPIGLNGAHQRRNAALAVAALEELSLDVSDEAVSRGIAGVRWRGRFERIAPDEGVEIVVDGAHNPEAARALAETWREVYGTSKATVIFGVVESKDSREMFLELEPIAEKLIFCAVNSKRGVSPEELAALCVEAGEGAVAGSIAEALAGARRGGAERILVAGSLFLAGEAIAELGAGEFEKSAQ